MRRNPVDKPGLRTVLCSDRAIRSGGFPLRGIALRSVAREFDQCLLRGRRPNVVLLVLTVALGPLALNLLVPSMPSMARDLEAGYGVTQLTLTLYLAGVAIGQLIYGPLSDRFGRRPPMLVGVALFTLSGIVCTLAPSMASLLPARIAQAVGGCAGMVLSRAIVRDVWGRDGSARVLALITMAMAAAPAIAPALGGYMDVLVGWRASFALLTAVGAVAFVAALLRLPETHFDRQPLPGIASLARTYATVLRQPVFLGFALNTAFTTAAFFSFLAGAPLLMTENLGRPPTAYGMLFMFVTVVYIAGNYLAARLSGRAAIEQMVLIGTLVACAGTITGLAVALAGWFTPFSLFLPMLIVASGNGLSMPNAIAASVGANPRLAATASGVLGFLQMTVGAAATVLVGHLPHPDQTPLVLVMVATSLMALAAFWLATRTATVGAQVAPAASTAGD